MAQMIQRQPVQEKSQNIDKEESGRRTPRIEFCALAALAQVLIAGYRYGVANQSIQISILKHLIDPNLLANDLLIQTAQHYPSMFFKWLAVILTSTADIQPAYFYLHILTTFGVACGVCLIAKGLTGKWTAGLLALLVMIAGDWSGLAESNLYTMEFTHTRAALALAVPAIGLYLNRKYIAAFILLGLTFCIHPLMACYVGAVVGVWLIADISASNWKRLVLSAVPAALIAAPIIMGMLADAQAFDSDWIRLVRIRSPHHVFPSTWWASCNLEIPQFMLLTGLAVLCASSVRLRTADSMKIKLMALVILGLFLCGYVFTELLPTPVVMRAQLFRSSRFLVLLSIVVIANWCVEEVRAVFAARRHMFRLILPALLICTMAIPALLDLLPVMLIVLALVLLVQQRLAWWASAWTGLVALCCVAAWRQIGFPLISLPQLPCPETGQLLGLLVIAAAVLLVLAYRVWTGRMKHAVLSGLALALFAAVLVKTDPMELSAVDSAWNGIQEQARQLTPEDALIMVPPFPGGFRIHSERAIVGEWRDGTQQFFDAEYTRLWWERMNRLWSGMMYDESGRKMLSRGLDFDRLSNDRIEQLCKEMGATFFVSKLTTLDFKPVAKSGPWILYAAARIVHPPPAPPTGASDAEVWAKQEEFMQEVVYPNIEKYRKSDVALLLTDSDGHPLKGASYTLRQISSSFLFGSALPNFIKPTPPQTSGNGARINDKYLARFKELFNFSIIGYAGKWNAIEGEKGKPWFDNLDKYVNWCVENGITIEYHFVSGYPPEWLKELSSAERKQHMLQHAERLIERYGSKIKYWQIVNERHNLNESPEVFQLFREKLPDARLGISNCARFYSEVKTAGKRKFDMVHGLSEMDWLGKKDVKLDFFGYHGHRPFGLWADVREMYEGLNYCGEYNVRVHISEFGMHLPHEMIGPIRTGQWTEELQAEYYKRYYTVCFSHPLVDAINLWGIGPNAWIKGGGLLDRNHEPKPAFNTLKKLIMEDWRTNVEGTVPLDGRLNFRGFHGGYEITITPKGEEKSFTSQFSVIPDSDNSFHITPGKLDHGLGKETIDIRYAGATLSH